MNSRASTLNAVRMADPLCLSSAQKSTDGKVKKVKLWPTGRFLDVRTLLWALRNKSYSLKLACKTQPMRLGEMLVVRPEWVALDVGHHDGC